MKLNRDLVRKAEDYELKNPKGWNRHARRFMATITRKMIKRTENKLKGE